MPLNREAVREAGTFAFHELRKLNLYETKTEGSLTTLSLFGDNYRFFFDKERKIAWMRSKHHYQKSSNFKLHGRHKEWDGVFSFARSFVHERMMSFLKTKDVEVKNTDFKAFLKETSIVAQQAYNANKKKIARIFGGVIWQHYDREIASLAMKIYGLGANSLDYSLIWNNKEEFKDTIQKAPGILPVWRDVVLAHMFQNKKNAPLVEEDNLEDDESEDDLFSSLLGQFSKKNKPEVNMEMLGFVSSSFNYPDEATSFIYPDIIKTTKGRLDSLGLTRTGWKYLIKLPPRSVQMLLVNSGITEFVAVINWLAHVGVIPRYSLIKPMMRNILSHHSRTEDFSIMVRAGLDKASKMKRGVKTFFEREMHLVLDWFVRGGEDREETFNPSFHSTRGNAGAGRIGYVKLDENQKKAGWNWFMRQQEIWHRETAAREAARHQAEADRLKKKTVLETWFSEIGEFEYKGYKVIPLTDSHSLLDEGREMHHCVGSYSSSCVDGRSRIFSIRKDGFRAATLEITNNPNVSSIWTVNQCRGLNNENVSEIIKKVSSEVVKRYNKAVNNAKNVKAIAV